MSCSWINSIASLLLAILPNKQPSIPPTPSRWPRSRTVPPRPKESPLAAQRPKRYLPYESPTGGINKRSEITIIRERPLQETTALHHPPTSQFYRSGAVSKPLRYATAPNFDQSLP